MVTDPIADLLIRLGNGAMRRHDSIHVPASRLKREMLAILQREGYILGIEDVSQDGHPAFKVSLRYVNDEQPMITGTRRVSKPGRRVYVGAAGIPKVRNGIGMAIISTSKGLMTDAESRRSGMGGEVLCSVW
ncbi:MAG: 30S ribosomal protein S8 [Nitrospiraceae bacterium]